MALIVEDGTIVAGAESYISVTGADTYLAKYGKDSVWKTKTVAEKEILLRISRLYMDTKYYWKGKQATAGHETNWPRSEVYVEGNLLNSDTVPADISNSNALLASESASGALYRNIDGGTTGQLVKSLEDGIGPLKSKTEYYDGASLASGSQVSYTEVNAMLRLYTLGGTRLLQRS
tara:strand:- start:8995 stop:9522 length:528 start_codon:yes stop_codon:yes gene_type:complete